MTYRLTRGYHWRGIGRAFRCVDCSACTDRIAEYYMVDDNLWSRAGMTPNGGMLCIGCLESRIGRQLVPIDFTGAPINGDIFPQSDRLRDRMCK